jgi:hypothetical protein
VPTGARAARSLALVAAGLAVGSLKRSDGLTDMEGVQTEWRFVRPSLCLASCHHSQHPPNPIVHSIHAPLASRTGTPQPRPARQQINFPNPHPSFTAWLLRTPLKRPVPRLQGVWCAWGPLHGPPTRRNAQSTFLALCSPARAQRPAVASPRGRMNAVVSWGRHRRRNSACGTSGGPFDRREPLSRPPQ